jgi:hypothetical protein
MLKTITAIFALAASTSAAAADLLPLMRGVYAREGVPCRGASNVDTLSYWGSRNGLNIQQEDCTIRRMTRRQSVYALHRLCRAIRYQGVHSDRLRISILDSATFTVIGEGGGQRTRFRYCGPQAQF